MAKAMVADVRQRVEEAFGSARPGLVALAVGEEDASSRVYLASQKKSAAKAGIDFSHVLLPSGIAQREAEEEVRKLNRNDAVHGIIIQRPLPSHLDALGLISAVDPGKDVEGLHPVNLGAIVHGRPRFVPCTAKAAVRLFQSLGLSPKGLEVVVVGHSEIVGKPIALLLVHELATLTLCHIGTKDLKAHTTRADLLFVAAGVPGLIKADMVKPGAAVIDIGINRVPKKEGEGKGSRIVGDVVFDEVSEIAGFITPVPGGVGPVTTAVLMENTLKAALDQGE